MINMQITLPLSFLPSLSLSLSFFNFLVAQCFLCSFLLPFHPSFLPSFLFPFSFFPLFFLDLFLFLLHYVRIFWSSSQITRYSFCGLIHCHAPQQNQGQSYPLTHALGSRALGFHCPLPWVSPSDTLGPLATLSCLLTLATVSSLTLLFTSRQHSEDWVAISVLLHFTTKSSCIYPEQVHMKRIIRVWGRACATENC